jgi:rRNA maturation endonuclease Nob1
MPRRLDNAERQIAALDAFKERACTGCGKAPKAKGDHFCPACREDWNKERERHEQC